MRRLGVVSVVGALAAAAAACGGSEQSRSPSASADASPGALACTAPPIADDDPSAGYDGGGPDRTGDGFVNGSDAPTPNGGAASTISTTTALGGVVGSLSGLFNRSLGTNGRRCHDCHETTDGWSLSPATVAERFAMDPFQPLFQTNDGSTSPNADVSTLEARRRAFALLIDRGLIRVGLPMPEGAELALVAVDDPYAFASARELSLFRRPLPAQNLKFLSDVMWDGRETGCGGIATSLGQQARDAVKGHAQGAEALDDASTREIVAFERSLFFAQITDAVAGALDRDGALGGPMNLAAQPFARGAVAADGRAFTLFDAWRGSGDAARAQIARGQELFDARRFVVRGVRGMNDDLGSDAISATCASCHDVPNVGSNANARRFDIGISDASRRAADVPLYTFALPSGERIAVTDPGRALVTGSAKDLARFKVPTLRGLAARAPYFHDGSARDLRAVVDYLDVRFAIGLTDGDKEDLGAFLGAL